MDPKTEAIWVLSIVIAVLLMANAWLWRHLFDAELTIDWKDYALDCQLRDKAELMARISDLENR